MQLSEEYKQSKVLATKLTAKIDSLLGEYDNIFENKKMKNKQEKLDKIEAEILQINKERGCLYEQMEAEESRIRIEYWKTYRGAITKLEVTNGELEQFLKNYRSNFTGKKSEEDEKLISLLSGDLSQMSKYTLNLINDDFEDAEEDVDYFQDLRRQIQPYL